ncbi:class I SAM-dependent methyltransferase [Halothiobacillus sp.]|uniref:class I SAM-dependent methyltransferase n=1 Tax=Halothiobacillus sp. TaxID=1891311 RepID=UPI002AD310C0|nr:class I SAM-dependent methyltransferase [Halothiobacillus sp.]
MSTESDNSSWRTRVFVDAGPDEVTAIQAKQVAEHLGLSLEPAGSMTSQTQFCLRFMDGGWQLWPPVVDDAYGRQPLQIDFVSDPRFSQPMTLREPLAKAVGLRANRRPLVFDLTAGLGRDAWALASTGCRVVAFERHPLVALLLADGLRRAALQTSTSDTASRISLLACDPRAVDSGIEDFIDPATVWLMDPMFPERRKSALVKKAMRIFQALVGNDDDATELFSWARQQPGARWVVKRPPQAPCINDSAPSMEITSGRIRFDCYL